MIEYFKSDIGFVISMFVVLITGVGIGAGLTDAIYAWKPKKKGEKHVEKMDKRRR